MPPRPRKVPVKRVAKKAPVKAVKAPSAAVQAKAELAEFKAQVLQEIEDYRHQGQLCSTEERALRKRLGFPPVNGENCIMLRVDYEGPAAPDYYSDRHEAQNIHNAFASWMTEAALKFPWAEHFGDNVVIESLNIDVDEWVEN